MELGTEEILRRKGSPSPSQTLGRKWRPPALPTLRLLPSSRPPPPAHVPSGLARAPGQRLGQGEPRPPAPPRGWREGAGSEPDYKSALEPMPAACEKHFPSIHLHPLTKHLTLGRGVQASSLLPLLPSEPCFPPAAVCLRGGRRQETKRQRARLTARVALPRGRRAQAGGALPPPAPAWLTGHAASLSLSSLWWLGLEPRTSADARASDTSPAAPQTGSMGTGHPWDGCPVRTTCGPLPRPKPATLKCAENQLGISPK